MRRIYVAGSTKEAERCAEIMRRIRAVGGIVTHDWTRAMDVQGKWEEWMREQMYSCAAGDIHAVRNSDLMIFVLPYDSRVTSRGAHVELGAAVALGIPILFLGTPSGSIFYSLAAAFFHDEEELIEHLTEKVLHR